MNNNQFDNFTREFGKGISRRDALKLLVAAAAGIGASSILRMDGDELNIGTQTAAAKWYCAPTNFVSAFPCSAYITYRENCSVICPDGERLFKRGADGKMHGADGCTMSDVEY